MIVIFETQSRRISAAFFLRKGTGRYSRQRKTSFRELDAGRDSKNFLLFLDGGAGREGNPIEYPPLGNPTSNESMRDSIC